MNDFTYVLKTGRNSKRIMEVTIFIGNSKINLTFFGYKVGLRG